MVDRGQPQYRKPSPQLAEAVRALFASARFLENDRNWRFAGGAKGRPSTAEVHGIFPGLHESLSRWIGQQRAADGPDFQLNFTNRLIAIFSADRQSARVDPRRLDDFDAVLRFWREDPDIKDRVKAVLETLREYRASLFETQKQIGLGKTRDRMRSLAQLGLLQVGPWDTAPLSTKDFALDEATFSEQARAYLRGAEPTFAVAHHAAVDRRSDVRRICNLIRDGASTIQVSAPIAEGVTTILMQTAAALVAAEPDRPVFWCTRGLFDNEPRVIPTRHVVIIDDLHDADDIPRWLPTYSTLSTKSVVIIGCRQLASRKIARSISSRVFRVHLNAVSADYAQRYVSRILKYGAADDATQDLVELFVEALSYHDGGLFPAMYAATRGELLENRYSRLVESMDNTDPRLDALASLIFCDAIRTSSRGKIRVPTLPILEAMCDQLEPRSVANLVRVEMTKLVDSFEGEVRIRPQGLLEIRHPSITHLLYRWIFGSAQLAFQGERRRFQWDFYKRLAVALINLRGPLGLPEILSLVAAGTNTARYREQKRYQEEIISACQLLMDVLDAIESELEPAGIDLARVHIARADLQIELRERTKSLDQATELKMSALASLSKAAEAGGRDLGVLLEVAHVLERVAQPAQIKVGEMERDWQSLFVYIADTAARDGNFAIADNADRGYLRKLLSRARGGGKGRSRSRAGHMAIISRLVKKTDVARSSLFDRDRLQILFDLYRGLVENPLGAGMSETIPRGDWDDQLPDSRRSIYRAIWRELYRLKRKGNLDRTLGDLSLFRMLELIQRKWVDDEGPDTRIRMGGSLAEWISFADAYAANFQDERLPD